MSVFKGAQKVFDYSKKKITQVVESSKSSGWMHEKRNERSELFHRTSAFQKENGSLKSVYPSQSAKTDQPLDLPSTNKWPLDPKNNRPSSASSNIKSTGKSSKGGQSDGQSKTESLLIGDLTESTPKTLDLLDSSIEFVTDNSQNILNPTPSQFSAQSINNDPLKSLGLNQPINFSSANQSSQFSKNTAGVSNQQFTPLKSTNINLQLSSSNSSLNRSRTTSQKPSNPSNLESLDPFADISDLRRSNSANSKAKPMNATKQPENGVNILPMHTGKEDPKILNFSQNQPLINPEFLSTKNQAESKNTAGVSNQQFAPLKSTNINLQLSSSNSSLNRSRTTSQKPSNTSNLESLDPFADISDLRRSNSANSKARPMNATKQPENGVNILPMHTGKEDPKILNFSQNQPLINPEFLSTKNQAEINPTGVDLLDGTFDFSSASVKVTPSLTPAFNLTTSSTVNVKNSSKTPFSESFMIFDSISAGNTETSNQSHSVYESASQRSEADIYKDKGNTLFKSGQYAEAEIQYSLGIKSVSGGHPSLAALYNNRAVSRLKIGSYNEAIEDCNKVQEIEPNEVKSLLRRAQAYEALEKWDDAQVDYRKILVIDPNVKSVSQSLARCAKALQPSANVHAPRSRPSKASESVNFQNVLQPVQKRFYSILI
jgi:hypothetical protein